MIKRPTRTTLAAGLGTGLAAGAAGGALAAFVTFWLLVLGGFLGGPRPSPSPWTWQGVMLAQLYLLVFAGLGAVIGGLLGLPVGLLAAWLLRRPPSDRAARALALAVSGLGMAAMLAFERALQTGGPWMTASFLLGGFAGGVLAARFWLRLWARGRGEAGPAAG